MGKKSKCFVIILIVLLVAAVVSAAETVHILSSGETLYSLSRKYGVQVEDLLKENGIDDPSSLSIGMRLIIPGEEDLHSASRTAAAEYHTVNAGDTYYGIAREYGLTVDRLLELNGRDRNRVLRVGESLIVGSSVEKIGQETETGAEPERIPRTVTLVNDVPWWPVAGIKKPLDGKLVGVSIEAEPRSYVHAVSAGNVVWTGPYRGFGNVVLVDSGGYIYLYGGNDDLFVNVGQNVTAGNRIGRLGTSGPAGGKQEMIFSVFREGVPVSPEDAPRG